MSLLKSFVYAFIGFKTALIEQRNMKIHIVAAAIAISLGFYFNINSFDWIVVLILIGMVISFELINTAIEYLTDLVTKEQHPIAGKVKDIAAAAVLVIAITSLIIGIIIFSKYV